MSKGLCVIEGTMMGWEINNAINAACNYPEIIDYWPALSNLRNWYSNSQNSSVVQVVSGELTEDLVSELCDIDWVLDEEKPNYSGFSASNNLLLFDLRLGFLDEDSASAHYATPAQLTAETLLNFWNAGNSHTKRVILAPSNPVVRDRLFHNIALVLVNYRGIRTLRDSWKVWGDHFELFQFTDIIAIPNG